MFYVGQRVTPNGRSSAGNELGRKLARSGISVPKFGDVVRIKTINVWHSSTLLTFVEHDNSHLSTNGYEPGFNAECFSPVVERPNDGEAFVRALKDACAPVEKEKERVPAFEGRVG
jgi:hypothetical protein